MRSIYLLIASILATGRFAFEIADIKGKLYQGFIPFSSFSKVAEMHVEGPRNRLAKHFFVKACP